MKMLICFLSVLLWTLPLLGASTVAAIYKDRWQI